MLSFAEKILYSGVTWNWTESIDGKSAAEYSLKISIKMGTNTAVTMTATASGTNFVFAVSSTTSNLPAGVYNYQAKLTKLSDQTSDIIETGKVSVLANLESNQDPREFWLQVVDALSEIYLKLASREVSEATYNGRTFKYRDMIEIRKLIDDAEIKAGIAKPIPIILEQG